MNDMRQVVAHLNDSSRSSAVMTFAVAVADAVGARVSPIYAVDPPLIGAFLTPEGAAAASEAAQRETKSRRDRVAALCERFATALPLEVEYGGAQAALVQRSRTTDLMVVAQPYADDASGHAPDLPEKLIVASACPLLFVPREIRGRKDAPPSAGRRVLVAWTDSRECARAVHDSLPILQRAAVVELLHLGAETPRTAMAQVAMQQHLQRHGIEAARTVIEPPATSFEARLRGDAGPDEKVADALLRHAIEHDVDLLVMGAYSRPRALEWILGGVTRSMMRAMTVPVLMSH